MPASQRRGPWVQEEDNTLLQLVRSQGPNNWVRISQHMHYRSAKQCRERYHQNLKPSLNHDPITPEEGLLIDKMVKEMGKRWAEIARRLGQRSDNAVKNWWNGSMNRRRRFQIQHDDPPSRPRYTGPQQPLPYVSTPAGAITSLEIPREQRQIEPPLISPSASEVSTHDSIAESAPSLIADSASNTASPNAHSPSCEFHLPPLVDRRIEERRPSLPILHIGSNFYTHDEVQALSPFSAPTMSENKISQSPTHSDVRPELVVGSRFARHQQSQSLSQLSLPPLYAVMHEPEAAQQWTSPSQPLSSSPEIQMSYPPVYPIYSPQSLHTAHSPSRDARMHVSNLMS